MLVKHDRNDSIQSKNSKLIPFRDIKQCTLPLTPDLQGSQADSREPFVYMLELETSERLFYMYVTSIEEREMWVDGFQYILETKE